MTDSPGTCTKCGHVFRGNGWDGPDAHYAQKGLICNQPYRQIADLEDGIQEKWLARPCNQRRPAKPEIAQFIPHHPKLTLALRCTPEVRQKIYPTDVIVNSEPLI